MKESPCDPSVSSDLIRLMYWMIWPSQKRRTSEGRSGAEQTLPVI